MRGMQSKYCAFDANSQVTKGTRFFPITLEESLPSGAVGTMCQLSASKPTQQAHKVRNGHLWSFLTLNSFSYHALLTYRTLLSRKSLDWSCQVCRFKTIIIFLFPRFVGMFVRLTKKPITGGVLDVRIEMDPLWNHVLKADESDLALVKWECESGDLLLSFHEAINLVWATKSTSHISGSIAEVDSFHGGSANLVLSSDLDETRKMHLPDTFVGLPEITEVLDDAMNIGDIKGSPVSTIKLKLQRFNERTQYHVGFFPDTTKNLPLDSKFFSAFRCRHLSNSTCLLGLFLSVNDPGGFMLFHDYSSVSCPGVRHTIDSFFLLEKEVVIPLWHTQALVIKQ